MKTTTLVLLILFSLKANAGLVLNIGILHHKGIDKGITLLSEFHSKEEVPPQKELRIKMREGVEVRLMVDFPGEPDLYGPSARLSIDGKVYSDLGKEMAVLSDGSHVQVGQELSFQVKDNIGQLIEVSLKPEFQ